MGVGKPASFELLKTEPDDLVAPISLGLIQRLVGDPDYLFRGGFLSWDARGNAHADRHIARSFRFGMFYFQPFHIFPQCLGNGRGPLNAGSRKKTGEFFTAVAGNKIAGPVEYGGQTGSHGL